MKRQTDSIAEILESTNSTRSRTREENDPQSLQVSSFHLIPWKIVHVRCAGACRRREGFVVGEERKNNMVRWFGALLPWVSAADNSMLS